MALTQIAFDFDAPPAEVKQEEKQPVAPVMAEQPVEEEAVISLEEEIVTSAPEVTVKLKRKSTRGRMSVKDMEAAADLVAVPEDEVLFQKMYYSIGSVSEMFRVNQSLIRFWENEFDILKPRKNGKGDRLFRPEDVKNLKLIYHLLRERKYTMEGAKDFLKQNKKAEEKFAMIESLKKMRSFLHELKAGL
jgi:DNA-binding transcriptional MerR regulator